jgi:methyl-accepting chemotaxis protein
VTIRNKLMGMAAVVLLAIATMAGVTYYRGDSMMRDQVDKAGMEIVQSAAGNIDGLCNTAAGVVRTASDAVRYAWIQLGAKDEDGVERILSTIVRQAAENGVSDIYVGHETNGRLSDGLGWKEPGDYDARTRPWYKEAVAAGKGKLIFTDPYVNQNTKKAVVSVATALYDDAGKLMGVLTGDMDIAAANESIANLKVFGKGYGMLLLRSGIVAAGPVKDDILKANLAKDEKYPEELRAIAKKMIAGESGCDTYSYQGEEKQLFYAPTQYGFYLGIQYPVSEITATVRGLTTILLVIAALAFLITGLVILFIVRSLTKSIGSMEAATTKLGAGDLTVCYDASGKDEIAHISRILNGMVASLREVMTSIRKESEETARRAETLASLSEETLSSMEEVSVSIEKVQGMMEQSSSALQETNASIEEIASGAQSAAKAAGDGAEGAAKASEAAGSSVEEVDTVIGNIRNAEGESKTSIDRIKNLAKSVEDISGFVATITSIADQTNLLALNAAIEAARAGEAGRGFAVVAEEVRKLAEESARAAHEVNKLIDGLQRHSADSIAATETTGKILEETMKKASATQTKLQNAVSEIAKMAEAVQNIAAVSEEQAASSGEMTSAIQSVTESTGHVVESVGSIQSASRETTKAAEAIATEAQEMAKTSESLQNLVARFTLDDASQKGLVPKR